MTAYSLTANFNIVRRNLDGAFIPNDPSNQDWIIYQNWVNGGGRADPYVPVSDTPQQKFNTALAAGMNTVWTISGSPDGSLNGLYAIDPQTQFNITAETVTILTSGAFATGGTTRFWLNMAGVPMPMNIAQFQAFALAVSAYVNALYGILAEQQAGVNVQYPSNQVTIDA